MAKKPAPCMIDEENPEWTEEMFRRARPASEVLPEIFGKEAAEQMLARKPGRVLGSGVKEPTTLRLDRDILAAFKGTGKGWQTRLNNALREWLHDHPLPHS